MDHNSWTLGNRVPRQNNDFWLHEDEFDTERVSSPAPESSDVLHVHRELPDFWSNTDPSPSPPAFQGASHAHSPLPSVGCYSGRRDRSEAQVFGFPRRQFDHFRSYEEGGKRHSSYNTRWDRSEMPRLHHPINLHNYPSRLSHPTSTDEHTPEYHVASSNENTTRKGSGWRLRPVSELPDRFRGVFKFGVFNVIQSACFDQVLYSEENLVISAPTGSGKTVLFELSMIRMLTQTANDARPARCVYVAPTKALCAEKHNEWVAKFGGLGVKCCELTGDTLLLGRGVWGDAKSSHIIVTTAEKWDSLTRNWADHSGILSQVKLFLVDEVHVLNESRGSTLEVITCRMKARGSGIRFLLISATIPNVEDVACWIGSSNGSHQPARIFQFGEEFRPCKLTKFVHGVAKPKGQNDFAYARTLDLRLFPVMQQHSAGKPILVFCPTRRGTVDTAKQLAKDYEQAMKTKKNLPWPPPIRIDHKFHDKDLAALASMGVAVHHAGLNADDRKAVEELYLRKALHVLVATSTLAVGVNLPAQMVVIKGVKLYQNGEMREYSDLDIMQMMGRAGRPQFDTEGTAIILCEPELEHKYRTLTQGNTALESSLHQNLAEHLNSEIGMGTISTIKNAKDWLRHSFLFRRIQKNPCHYDIGKNKNQTWEEKIDEIVMQSILSLHDTQLIAYNEEDERLSSTEYGDVMSKFYIRQTTMRGMLNLPCSTTTREILELVSVSEEVSDLKLRNGEKPMYEKIRRHSDIRFPPKKIVSASDKILLLIQAILAGLPLNSSEFKSTEGQPYLEAVTIFRHATRIVTAVAEVAIINKSGAQLKHALELGRCLNAKAWEDRPLVLRQIEHIGEKSVKVLAENGISSIPKLLQTSPLRIEELLYRRPPFGFEVLAAANEFPKYHLDVKELTSIPSDGNSSVEVEFSVQCALVSSDTAPQRVKKAKWGKTEMTTLLIVTSDMAFIDFRRIATKALKEKKEFTLTAQLTKPSQLINVYIASEKFAGVTVAWTLAPSVPPSKYPTLETRPLTSIEMDLQGLEDVPDFWDIDLDDSDEIPDLHVLDLTKRRDDNASKAQQCRLNPPFKQQAERDPRKRPDGKYECNHTCKDKLKCRHYCCQEGLLEPPRATKKRQVNARDSDAKPIPPARNVLMARSLRDEQKCQAEQTPAAKESRTFKPANRNPIRQQSGKMHENANVTRNSLLVRPNMESSSHLKKSRDNKTMPNFDLQMTTLKRSRPPTPKELTLTDDCCDELPLISEIREQNNATSYSVEAEGSEGPRPKRSRTDVTPGSLGPFLSHKKAIPREITTELSKRQLFFPSSNDEDTADQCGSHSASGSPVPYIDESYFDTAPDPAVGLSPANDWNVIRSVSSQRPRDDISLLCGGFGVTPNESPQGSTPSKIRRNNSYTLSPSRIRGFMRPSGPRDQDPIGCSTINSRRTASLASKTPDVNGTDFQTLVETSDSNDVLDDPLSEFDRWFASGAVEIIPD